jgi:hypothetical protein
MQEDTIHYYYYGLKIGSVKIADTNLVDSLRKRNDIDARGLANRLFLLFFREADNCLINVPPKNMVTVNSLSFDCLNNEMVQAELHHKLD